MRTDEFRTRVWCTFTFEGFHQWNLAPDDVEYLRHVHRHLFGVRAEWCVSHGNREIEFHTKRKQMIAHCEKLVANDKHVVSWSCELWAGHLSSVFNCCVVEVDEDGENGARHEQCHCALRHR